jgi:1-acyl-sn-glycerol-3-phosphate acyltransferase
MKENKAAGKLLTLWIMFKFALCNFSHCTRLLVRAWRGKLTRAESDARIHAWSTALLKILNIKLVIHNPHQVTLVPGQRVVVMVNHSSLFDIPLSFMTFPHNSLRMLAKKELFDIPLFGRTMKAVETIAIDRDNRKQAAKDLETARAAMESGIAIWISPEGTRSETGELGPLKMGGFVLAIKTQALIIPLTIRGANKILQAHTWSFHLGQTVEMCIGAPIDASQYTMAQRDELLSLVEAEIRQNLMKGPSSVSI